MENDDYITDTMKRFKPVDMQERYPELIHEAEQKQIGYKEFLINLLLTVPVTRYRALTLIRS